MAGAVIALSIAVVVLLATLGWVLFDSRAVRQRLRNQEGGLTAARLDLQAARERVVELHTYLIDHDHWAPDPEQPTPARIAERRMPDRWASPSGIPRRPPSGKRSSQQSS